MIKHIVTENIVQSGNSRKGHLVCSCGVETHEEDLRKVSLRVLRAQMAHMHEQINPETRKVVKLPKPKKSELTELREEIQKEVKKQKKSKTRKDEPQLEEPE